jgi:TorA maturation chaperone TorD
MYEMEASVAVNNVIQDVLQSRAYSYLLFQNLFGSEPTEKLLRTACGKETFNVLDVYAVDGGSPYSSALSAAILALESLHGRTGEDIERLQSEYTKLYIGPLELRAPPWESIYVSKKMQLFDENTLNVRNFYRSQGFLPTEYPKVADDHIALECAFMARLGDRACTACSDGEYSVAKDTLDASCRFMKEHLLLWLPSYVADLEKIKEAEFYPIMARLVMEYATVDYGIILELVAEI